MYNTEQIQNRSDFIKFLNDFMTNIEDWENSDLNAFLSAMSDWVQDADGYYENIGVSDILEHPSWRLLADILIASSMYE